MFLNWFKTYEYFIVYSAVNPEAEKDSKLSEENVKRMKDLRDKRQYSQYLQALTKQNVATNKLNFLNPKIHTFIGKYFKRRLRSIDYFEPCASSNPLITYAVYGTAGVVKGKLNRNVLIFLLELFAHIKDPERFSVTDDFSRVTKVIDDIEISIYKIKKHGK
jgi:hypothetical protein